MTVWESLTNPTAGVSLQNAKDQCRVTDSADDAYIQLLIDGATLAIEKKTRNLVLKRSCKMYLDTFEDEILFPVTPIVSVTSVKYYLDGTLQTLNSSLYQLDKVSKMGRLKSADGYNFPFTDTRYNAVEIEFIAGHATDESDVPKHIKNAILFLVAHWYTTREPVINGISVLSNKIPHTFEYVLGTFKFLSI